MNALGFDIAELDIATSTAARSPSSQVVDAGHHSRRLLRLTGLDTEENQARRLLNDLDTFAISRGLQGGDEAVIAHRWLTESFEEVINRVPPDLMGKRDPAQLYHELLEYRWYQSQRENREVPLQGATEGYIRDVLRNLPDEAMSMLGAPTSRTLVNPYDPSLGYRTIHHRRAAGRGRSWEARSGWIDLADAGRLDMSKLLKGKQG